jgi:hypothetical protein
MWYQNDYQQEFCISNSEEHLTLDKTIVLFKSFYDSVLKGVGIIVFFFFITD